MSHNYVISASLREDAGKGASRRLRREGSVPAVLYGGDRDPVSLVLDHNTMFHKIREEAFHSSIITLQLEDGRSQQVVLRDTQVHPIKPLILHMDFMRIDENQALHLTIPLHFTNEASSPAGKTGGVVISHQATEVEVIALPKNLPEFIEVDLGNLEPGQSVMLSDIALPEDVSLAALSHGEDSHDAPVASASYVAGGADDEAEEAAAE